VADDDRVLQTFGSDGAKNVPAQTLPFAFLLLPFCRTDRPLTQALLPSCFCLPASDFWLLASDYYTKTYDKEDI